MSTFQPSFPHQHLLGIEGLKEADISQIIDLADKYVDQTIAESQPVAPY